MKKAFGIGVAGSFFFAFTFILNRSMNLGGGDWMWSASLRYLFTLPMMAVLLMKNGGASTIFAQIKAKPVPWLGWSSVGFWLFYTPLTFASVFSPSWMVAATWQITIVCGVLLTPVFGVKIPVKNLLMSCIILVGVFVLQIPNVASGGTEVSGVLTGLLLIVIAAFSYPLGNRKIMEIAGDITTTQRVFGMTLCSMPLWIVTAVAAFVRSGLPSGAQVMQSALVALFSGVVATVLFFRATDLVRRDQRQLAMVEATQSGEVVFTLLGSVLILHDTQPSLVSLAGIAIVVIGMVLSCLVTGDSEGAQETVAQET